MVGVGGAAAGAVEFRPAVGALGARIDVAGGELRLRPGRGHAVPDVAEAEGVVTGENREGMFFAARTFAMKLGQSIAMLVFTSLAIIGVGDIDYSSNDLTASATGLMIVAFVAVTFCVLGAIILSFYREKKVMKTIAKKEDSVYLNAIGEDGKTEE